MATTPLTIYVDSEAARAFHEASAEEREAMQILLSSKLEEIIAIPNIPLRDVMNEMGREAESRGLTVEILDSIKNQGRLSALRQAKGMWKDRDDLPTLEDLRKEWDRF